MKIKVGDILGKKKRVQINSDEYELLLFVVKVAQKLENNKYPFLIEELAGDGLLWVSEELIKKEMFIVTSYDALLKKATRRIRA